MLLIVSILKVLCVCFQHLGAGLAVVPLMGVVESVAIGNAFGMYT